MLSHPELDILECKVKWALRSTAVNKTSGCNEIPAELFKSLKDDAIKISHSLCQQIWKPSSGHRTGKGQSSSQFPRRVLLKNVLTIRRLHSSRMLVRSCLKSCMLGFSIMVNQELPDVQAGFRKGRGTRDQIANICWIIEKAREFQENIYLCFIDNTKAFDYVDHDKL